MQIIDACAIQCGHAPILEQWRGKPAHKLSRGQRVCAFIEKYIKIPEGAHVGKPLKLATFQEGFILSVYDNPHGTSRAYLSIARKNAKTAIIAAMCLAHIVGPEAKKNSQIISGAMSRDQASLVFNLMQKMIGLSPELSGKSVVKIIPSKKSIIGIAKNVEYKAISAEGATAHGLSPVLAILDEVGQVRGHHSDFIEAITTSQGAHEERLLVAISTQAATDSDLFSLWLDDAKKSNDPHIVSHVYSAPKDCSLDDESAWRAANPALGAFRSESDLREAAARAARMPTDENSFRWLFLNQRIEAESPFVSKKIWDLCGKQVSPLEDGDVVYGGLDLSEVNDLTALVFVKPTVSGWDVHPTFWLPEHGLADKSKSDRVPYDIWARSGHLNCTPGATIDYDYVASLIYQAFTRYNIQKIGFDRWNWRHFKPALLRAGFPEHQIEGDDGIFIPLGQGFQTMTGALRALESALLEEKIAHNNHPVLAMCAANTVVVKDPSGNKKFTKSGSRGRIDGMVALAMAMSVAETHVATDYTALNEFFEELGNT